MMVFSPEEAEAFQEEVDDDRSKLPILSSKTKVTTTKLQICGMLVNGLKVRSKCSKQNKIPEGLSFDFAYTPQYGEEGRRPNSEPPEESKDEIIAYSHIS